MEIRMSVFPGSKPGIAGKIQVAEGAEVEKGTLLAQVETGKGNRPVKAPEGGVIRKILFSEGDEIKPKQLLFELEERAEKEEAKEAVPEREEPAEEKSADILIIGGGPGGYVAAIYAAKRGKSVILAEKEALGGTCLNAGCIPTKALVRSAEVCHEIAGAAEFGIQAEKPCVDMKRVIARKDEVKKKLLHGIQSLMDSNQIQVLEGTAEFLSETQAEIRGKKRYLVKAKDIIVATGSKTSKIPIPGMELPMVMNSTKALDLKELPQSVAIIGGGVIGMEFAFIYAYLGAKVHVVEFMDRLLTMVDKEASEAIEEEAKKAGIQIHTKTKVKEIKKAMDNQAVVVCEGQDGESLIVSEKVLVAIGREPDMDGLGWEKAGLELNERGRGLKADSHMRTNKEHIYAIGDVTNIMQLAHVASHQGITAVKNILGEAEEMDYTAVPNVIFTAPEIASTGLTEEACQERQIAYKVSRFSYEGNGKALALGRPQGFIKLIGEKETGRILGCTIMGADASALIAAVTLAIKNHVTADQIAETIFAHPTTGEVIHEAAMGLGIGALHQ